MNCFTGMSEVRLWLILLVLSLGACGRGADGIGSESVGSPVVALVNGQPLLREDFEAFVSLGPDEQAGGVDSGLRLSRFREFLTEQLLLQEAKKAQITVTPEELQHYFDEPLPSEGEMNQAWRDRVTTWTTVHKFVKQEIGSGIQVTNMEMNRYYESHQGDFVIDDQAHVLEVLVDDRNLAEEIRRRINVGDVRTFKEMARTHSQGLTAQLGGDLGVFARGQLPENFEEVIFDLGPGEASGVFHSSQGYHIFMLEEWVPRHAQKFYEVQGLIFDRLVEEKERAALDDYVAHLFETASIEIRDEDLRELWGRTDAGIR